MRHHSRLHTALTATGLAAGLALTGCASTEVSGAASPEISQENLLKVHAQLRQAAGYAAGLIACMSQDEKAAVQIDAYGTMTNYDHVRGPDKTLNTADDGQQSVILELDMYEPLYSGVPGDEIMTYRADEKDGPYSLYISGYSGAGKIWKQEGESMSPGIVQLGTKTLVADNVIVSSERDDSATYIAFPENYAPLTSEINQSAELVDTKKATQLSSEILEAISHLIGKSGITSCNLG